MRIAYLGYDAFSYCLDALIAAGCEVAAVYSFPTDGISETNTRLSAFAREKGIPFSTERVTEKELCRLCEIGVRMVFSAGYIYKLPTHAGLYMVNYHPAPLPVGRGAWPFPTAILRGMTEYGVALHKIAPSWDTGDILLHADFPLTGRENQFELQRACEAAVVPLLRTLPQSIDALWQNARPQIGGEYWKEPTEEERRIPYHASPEDADKTARAFFGEGVTVIAKNGEKISVTYPRYAESIPNAAHPDTVIPLLHGYILTE